MTPIEDVLADLIRAAIEGYRGERWTDAVPVEVSNRPDLADYASPVAFQMAKDARRPPLQIAQAIASELAGHGPGIVEAVVATPPAFLNIRLAPEYLAFVVQAAIEAHGAIADRQSCAGVKVVVEHTNINPNKAAHVGHFRNACLGDSLARILDRQGHEVEVQNYIDDTGVQVSDVVVGLRHLKVPRSDGEAFDRYCSRVYSAVRDAYDREPALLDQRLEVQKALAEGTGELAAYARDVATRIVKGNLRTMSRAGVAYDLLTWESDVLRQGFWEQTFAMLKAARAVRHEEDGPNAGTWVLPFGLGTTAGTDSTVTEDKVLVTSAGLATYTAKDLAYQLWKFGLLDQDFHYRRWGDQLGDRTLWTTTREAGDGDAPAFAGAQRVINVIDASQSYPQQVVYAGLRRLGFDDAAAKSEHLAYGLVTLTSAAARVLGIDVDEGTTTVAMQGRRGIQVYADDLLDRLEDVVADRGADRKTATAVAAGAARYYMLKFSTNQDIAFDFDEALRTTGETGVYLQYAYVRASGILRKVGSAEASPPPPDLPDLDRGLCLKMADYPRVMATAADTRSVATVAKYGFDLAAAFSAFYDNTSPVVAEADPVVKAWRTGLVAAFRLVMSDVLDILGIPALEQI